MKYTNFIISVLKIYLNIYLKNIITSIAHIAVDDVNVVWSGDILSKQ